MAVSVPMVQFRVSMTGAAKRRGVSRRRQAHNATIGDRRRVLTDRDHGAFG
jgi:hypothetical protein